MMNKLLIIFCWFVLVNLLASCQLTDHLYFEKTLQQQANDAHFNVQYEKSSEFNHLIIGDIQSQDGVLNIYIHGDSRQFLSGATSSIYSQQPMVWDLMQQDPNDKIFVSRPCYFLIKQQDNCGSKYWLSHRYSDEVIDVMAQVISGIIEDYPQKEIRLIGYSGGGAIGILLAHRINNLSAVVTVAGNLDVELWQQHHRYKPLTGSLNPLASALTKDITHWHFSGKKDSEILTAWTLNFAKKHHGIGIVMPDAGHNYGWVERWPSILEMIKNE